jgi:hypothetical protein
MFADDVADKPPGGGCTPQGHDVGFELAGVFCKNGRLRNQEGSD